MDMQHFAGGMMSYPEPPEFDYVAFLQAEDVPFQNSTHPHAVASTSESSEKATPPSSDAMSSSRTGTEVARRQSMAKPRLERRGHTKSRRGCYNCKRRRIKVGAE